MFKQPKGRRSHFLLKRPLDPYFPIPSHYTHSIYIRAELFSSVCTRNLSPASFSKKCTNYPLSLTFSILSSLPILSHQCRSKLKFETPAAHFALPLATFSQTNVRNNLHSSFSFSSSSLFSNFSIQCNLIGIYPAN